LCNLTLPTALLTKHSIAPSVIYTMTAQNHALCTWRWWHTSFQRLAFVAVYCLLFWTAPAIGNPDDVDSITDRISGRTFPSVFQAWNEAGNLKGEDKWTTVSRHDLVFHSPEFFGLRRSGNYPGLATEFTEDSVAAASRLRMKLLEKNSHLVILAELRYRDAHSTFLPENHEWWRRKNGKLVMGWDEGGYIQLDYSRPDFRKHIARQAQALMQTEFFDGIMLDWWGDDNDRLELVKEIRRSIGDKPLILVNANDRQTPRTAPYVNGYFMECYRSKKPEDWRRIAETLQWAEQHLRQPRINCVETWYHVSREDLHLMRATTTLALTLSNGYCLFSDPNGLPTPDHRHDWYGFWDQNLGKPKGAGVVQTEGHVMREFTKGTAVYNPHGNKSVVVKFRSKHTQASTGRKDVQFTVPSRDGDIFLKETGQASDDVRRDLKTVLAGTKWSNSNNVSFEWTKDGRFLHNGVERNWKVIDDDRVQVTFGHGHEDTIVFDEKMKSFTQLVKGGPTSFTGSLQSGSSKPTAPTPSTNASLVSVETLLKVAKSSKKNQKGEVIELDLSNVKLGDPEIAALGQIVSLQRLTAPKSGLSDDHISRLTNLKNLTSLGLWQTRISNEGLKTIGQFTNLTYLSVEGIGRVTNDGVAHLSDCRKLSWLGLSYTGVSNDGMRHLTKLPLTRIDLEKTAIGDDGLNHLAKISTLRTLTLTKTKVTDAGVAKLKRSLPNCKVIR
jgi:hypothetical protein